MTGCGPYRVALSAQLDGEQLGVPPVELDAHLAGCEACRRWAVQAVWVTRSLRLQPAAPVPDLTDEIATAIAAEPRAAASFVPPSLVRLALVLVACAQALAAVPALLGDDLGATVHVAHEEGAWGLALAAGLVFAAWRPGKATAMLPVLTVFVACLGVMTAADIATGRVAPSAEVPHLMAALGLVLVWWEGRPSLAPPRRRLAT